MKAVSFKVDSGALKDAPPFTIQVQGLPEPRRELAKVLERIARRICAQVNDCATTDGYTDLHWPSFLPAAEAAYDELLKIDEERATNWGKTA